MAVVPVFVDADLTTKLNHVRLQMGDILIIRMDPQTSEETVRHSVEVVQQAMQEAGIPRGIGIILTIDPTWQIEHLTDEQLHNHGLKRI